MRGYMQVSSFSTMKYLLLILSVAAQLQMYLALDVNTTESLFPKEVSTTTTSMSTPTKVTKKTTPTFSGINEALVGGIIRDIVGRSDGRVRPNVNGNPVVVYVDFHITSIGSINAENMDFTIDTYFRQTWHDHRASFDYKYPNYAEPVTLEPEYLVDIWTPELFFLNEKSGTYHHITTSNKAVKVYPNGTIWWSSRLTLKLSCPMDLSYFPMDRQVCPIKVSSFVFPAKDVILQWKYDDHEESVKFNFNESSLPQFSLTRINAVEYVDTFHSGVFSCLKVNFHLRRNFGYYVLQVYIPSSLITILSWLGFWINHEAVPARVGLGVTTVLTLSTQLGSARTTVGTVSYTRAIDVWYSFCMFYVFLTLAEFTIVNVLVRSEKSIKRKRSLKADKENNMEMQPLNEEQPNVDAPYKVSVPLWKRDLHISASNVDHYSRVLFPVVFAIFNLIYWSVYYRH